MNNSQTSPGQTDSKSLPAGKLDPVAGHFADLSLGTLWILLSGLLLIAGIAIGTAVMIDSFRERTIASTNRYLENTTLLLARHFDQKFEDLVDAQARLARRLGVLEIDSLEEFRRRLSSSGTRELLKSEISDTFDTADVFLYDSDGQVINTSQPGPIPNFNISDRAYFLSLKSNATKATTLVESVRSRVTGKPTTILARRLTNADGVFLGVMIRRIDSHQFDRFLDTLALGNGAAIAIGSQDGKLLARFPHVDEMIGKEVRWGSVFHQAKSRPGPATARVISAIDRVDRLASARQMHSFPIVVVATVATDAALADWREQTKR